MARPWPLLIVAGGALVAAGCGSGQPGKVARPQTLELNWRENCGTRADPIPIATRRVVAVGRTPSDLFGGFLCFSERVMRLG